MEASLRTDTAKDGSGDDYSDGDVNSEDENDVLHGHSRTPIAALDADTKEDIDGQLDLLAVGGRGGGVARKGSEAAFSPDSSLLQECYRLLLDCGTEGISVVDIAQTFLQFVDTSIARQLYRTLKTALAKSTSEVPKFIGRTRRLHLVLDQKFLDEAMPSGKEVGHVPKPVSKGGKGGATSLGAQTDVVKHSSPVPLLPSGIEPFSAESCSYMPSEFDGMSLLGRRRGQIVDYLIRNYHALRDDKLGRIIGIIEEKKHFQVDRRRVLSRIVDNLAVDKRARVTLTFESPGPNRLEFDSDGEDDACGPGVPSGEVYFIVCPDFDENSSDAVSRATLSMEKLNGDYSDIRNFRRVHLPTLDDMGRKVEVVAGEPLVIGEIMEERSTSIDPMLTLARKPCKRPQEISHLLSYSFAVINGWSVAVLRRAFVFDKTVFAYASEQKLANVKSCSETGISWVGVFREEDVVNFMSLRTFAEVIGLFQDYGEVEATQWDMRVGDLPDDFAESLCFSAPGKEQMAILLSCLYRLDLISLYEKGDEKGWWSVCGTVLFRDYGKGVPGLNQHVS